jgi:hypothetical protein
LASRLRRRPSLEVLEARALLSVSNVLVNDPLADGTNPRDTQNTAAITLGSDNTHVIVAFNDSTETTSDGAPRFTGWSTSADGGNSFTDRGAVPPSSILGDNGSPVLQYDGLRSTVILQEQTGDDGGIRTLRVYRSADNGATWMAPVNSTPAFPYEQVSQNWVAVDNFNDGGTGRGNIYQAFRSVVGTFQDKGVWANRSTDGGANWTNNVRVATVSRFFGTSPFTVRSSGPSVVVGPNPAGNHPVYVFWYDTNTGHGGSPRLLMKTSTDLGVSYGPATLVAAYAGGTVGTSTVGDLGLTVSSTDATAFPTNSFPRAAVNPVTGSLYVVYADKDGPNDRASIFFAESNDGGTTWGVIRQRLNDDATNNDQWAPSIAVTPDGTEVGVFWYDRRNDPANSLIDRYGVIGSVNTANGAVAFGANFRVSDVSFPALGGSDVVSGFPGIARMSAYDQTVADNTAFYTAWGDNRDDSAAHAGKNANVRFSTVSTIPQILSAIPDQTIPSSQLTLDVSLSATNPSGNPLTFSATGQSLAYVLTQQTGTLTYDPTFDNWGGRNEKWLLAAGGQWYFILPSGELDHWDGSAAASGTPLGNVGTSYYADPTRLTNPPANQPHATFSFSGITLTGATLTVTRDPAWVSTVVITVTVSDGTKSDSKIFDVFVTP